MSLEFRIDIAPNGQNLRLNLLSKMPGVPDAGQPFVRTLPIPNLSDADLDDLRRGNAQKPVVDQVTEHIRDWLLNVDLDPYLRTALAGPPGESVRLVFSINDEELRTKLSNVPFELCSLSGGGAVPLALHGKVASIVHLLPKVGVPPLAPNSGTWPLRVLIVRSNPLDLGGSVPPAAKTREEIHEVIDAQPKLDRDLVQVHVLSSEVSPDLAGKPTLDNLKKQLQKIPYDILVYLGHGDLLPVYQGLTPVGVLQMETEDATAHVTVPFDQIAVLLHERPVPVVILAGCLTAAEISAELKADVEKNIPQWMRGSQAVAQALINSESGVQFAVGMRFRLETEDAGRFIRAFFNTLLLGQPEPFKVPPGHVEAAVRAARRELYLGRPNSYSWSAPVIFRSLGQEPMFPHLASPPESVCPNTEQHQSLRAIFWEQLSKLAWNLREVPQSGAETVRGLLQNVEQQYVQSVLAKAPCFIVPGCIEGRHEGTVTVPVNLHGKLNVDELRADLVFGGGLVKVKSLEASQQLLDSGYQMLSLAKGDYASFYIEKAGSSGDQSSRGLPEGILLNATIELGQSYQVVYPASVNIKKIEPGQPVCTGNNAIIVPPP